MKWANTKFLKIYLLVLFVILVGVIVFLNMGKYKIIDNDTLEASDGTRYYRGGGYLRVDGYGKRLGRVKWLVGDADEDHKQQGVFSADSDGSDDCVILLKSGIVIRHNYRFGVERIYIKQGVTLDLCDISKAIDAEVSITKPNNIRINGEGYYFTDYPLRDNYHAAMALSELIGEENTETYETDRWLCSGYLYYKLDNLDQMTVCCPVTCHEKAGWIVTMPDGKEYRMNPEAFSMFYMTERHEQFLQNPVYDVEE